MERFATSNIVCWLFAFEIPKVSIDYQIIAPPPLATDRIQRSIATSAFQLYSQVGKTENTHEVQFPTSKGGGSPCVNNVKASNSNPKPFP